MTYCKPLKNILPGIICYALYVLYPAYATAQDSRLWATYCGGAADEFGWSVATDASGNVYLAGNTDSPSGIASPDGFQNAYRGNTDAFLVKFDADGNRLWGTYYGGTSTENGTSVVTDALGNVYLAGWTGSATNIASNGFQNSIASSEDAFLVKFDASGNRLWATYYGGEGVEEETNVATDASGNVYLSGLTASTTGIAATVSFQNTFGGINDAYLVKFDASGNRQWATYYGGALDDKGMGVATDATGNVFLAGYTTSTNGIASGGFQNTYGGGGRDAFLVKFDATGNRLWGTYYGGTDNDWGFNVATDASGNVLLAGQTSSTSGIASGGFQNALKGYIDAMLVKFDSNGNRLWATYYGNASGTEEENSVATDAAGNILLAGHSSSTSGISSGGFQNAYAGGFHDAYLVKFDTTGKRICATYFGGAGDEYDYNVTTDNLGNIYLAGRSNSTSKIASPGSFQTSNAGGFDAYLAKFTSFNTSLNVSNVTTNAKCNGSCDGVVTLTVKGGTAPYGYSWSNGQTASAASGLCAGNYMVTITDAANATTSVAVNISEPALLVANTSTSSAACGQSNGTASVNVTGGVMPYAYIWSTALAETTQAISALNSGNYSVTVSDASNCMAIANALVGNTGGSVVASVSITATANHFCAGSSITFTANAVNGGMAPAYQWKVNRKGRGTDSNSYTDNTFNDNDTVTCILISNADCVITQTVVSNAVILTVDTKPDAGIITSSRDTLCEGIAQNLILTGGTGQIQWQSSASGNAFTDIAGATNGNYLAHPLIVTDFRTIARNGTCSDTSAALSLIVIPAPVASFTSSVTGRTVAFNSGGTTDAVIYNWDFGDNSPSGSEVNPSHIYNPGQDTFYVCLTAYNSSNCSFTFCRSIILNPTGVEAVQQKSSWVVYPNPVSDYLFIKTENTTGSIERVEVYDLLGKLVLSKIISNGVLLIPCGIDTRSLNKGMYYLKIETNKLNYIQPIVKQ